MAYRLWERYDRFLYERRMTQKEFMELTRAHTTDGKPISAMTLGRLKTQPNPPNVETIHALADTLGIDRDEAGILAGRLRPTSAHVPSVQEAIGASRLLTDSNKRTMIELYEQLTAANAARMESAEPSTPSGDNRSDDARTAI